GRSSTVHLAVASGGTQNVQLYLKKPRHHSVGHRHHRFRLGHTGTAVDTATAMNQRASQIPGNPNGNSAWSGTVARQTPGVINQGGGVNKGGAAVNNPSAGKK